MGFVAACRLYKNTQTIRPATLQAWLSPKPVLFIGCIGNSIFSMQLKVYFSNPVFR
jgi:hypothetical protein